MWAFFSRRLRMWLLFAVGAPVLAWLLGRLGDAVERRRGPNGFSSTLHSVRGWLRRRTRGPLSRRDHDPHLPAR